MSQTMPVVVVATADDAVASRLARALRSFSVERVSSASELWSRVREPVDVIVFDPRLGPNIGGVLRRRLAPRETPPEVVELARQDGSGAVLVGDEERFAAEVFALVHRRKTLERAGLVGRSTALFRVAELVLQAAPTPVTILIEGESGTGKELVARAVHRNSKRADGPFVVVNCAALAEGVLESELFGHERGAFTGAATRRQGMFELANGGTVFLDEIGELTASTQVKLLRVLEEREFMRVGGSTLVRSDARVVAATNRNLAQEVEAGRFRQDLYFRICVVRIELPPLRERPEDVEPLFWHFLRQISKESGRDPPVVSRLAMERLESYSWPGNVRELRNLVERLVVLRGFEEIRAEDVEHYLAAAGGNPRLPVLGRRREVPMDALLDALVALRHEVAELRRDLQHKGLVATPTSAMAVSDIEDAHEVVVSQPQAETPTRGVPSMEQVERETIESALREASGNRRKAAALLGIGERTLYRKILRYGLQEVR